MAAAPRAFLSYSSQDREAARRLATRLRAGGVDVWFDSWEIGAGESIVSKVFEEGLERCDVFVVLLSAASARSPWVAEELDAAFLRKLEREVRIFPVRLDASPPPAAIRHLRWVDCGADLEAGAAELLDGIHGVSRRPPLGAPPAPPRRPRRSLAAPARALALVLAAGGAAFWLGHRPPPPDPLADLPPDAARLARLLLEASPRNQGIKTRVPPEALHPRLPGWDHPRLRHAADALEAAGLAAVRVIPGDPPCRFGFVTPTAELFFCRVGPAGWLGYDPEADLRRVAAAAVRLERAGPRQLQEATGLDHTRLNRAVGTLRARDLATVVVPIIRPPWAFGLVIATHRTRALAEEASS